MIANDCTLLKEHGGSFEFSYKYCKSVFKKMGFVYWESTTAEPVITSGLIKEVCLTFFRVVRAIVQVHNIAERIIINIDPTLLPFVLISKNTVQKMGTTDYRQIKDIFGATLAGDFFCLFS